MEVDLNEIESLRRDKLADLKGKGINPYGERYDRTHLVEELIVNEQQLEQQAVRIAGRLMAKREHGKAAFGHLQDRTGQIQLYGRQDILGESVYDLLLQLDIGDIIGVSGVLFRTRRGELTLEINSLNLLAKSLAPLPEKWHGLKDIDLRYRQRYLDLIVNPQVTSVFIRRSKMIKAIRNFLDTRGFLEVETPTMHPIPGGASARPFITHHNSLNIDVYLRIAVELYLKRLLVGGLEQVYELGRIFRNEGISTRHNPEFTMLEVYQAYADYYDMMDLLEQMVYQVALEVTGEHVITYQEQQLDFMPPWRRLTMLDALKTHTGFDWTSDNPLGVLITRAKELGVNIEAGVTWGTLVAAVFEELVEPQLLQPTIVMDYPVETSPLAKRKEDDHRFTYRFEGFIMGREIANAFSELNDPIEQRERFAYQMQQRAAGDQEAQLLDEDFIRAQEYGMPPAGGLGVGIDRLVMLFTNAVSIRDVLLFPTMKPTKG